MAAIARALQDDSLETTKAILKAERAATTRAYDCAWRKFETFCKLKGKDPTAYDPKTGTEFLSSLRGAGRKSIEAARTSVSATWAIMHPERPPFGSHIHVKKLIKGIKEEYPAKPRAKPNWFVEPLLDAMRKIDSEIAPLEALSTKTAILLALATFWRPKSDLTRIRLEDVELDGGNLRLVATKPKEGEYKEISLSAFSESCICPVHCVAVYLKRTAELREGCSNLFITCKRPHRDISADGLGRWIKEALKGAGIRDTPHSLRGVAASKAFYEGVSMDTILKKGNWRSESVFMSHYLRPSLKTQSEFTL